MGEAGFRLDGGGETLVFLTPSAGAPQLAYWGPALGDSDPLQALTELTEAATPPGMLDAGEALSWLPEAGQGFTGQPALEAHRAGVLLVSQLAERTRNLAAGRADIVLADERAGIELALRLALDEATGVLESRTELRNLGDEPLTLAWLAAGALPSALDDLETYGGRWGREFQPQRGRLGFGQVVMENRTGRTSHHAPPFLVAGSPGFGADQGEVFALHLAWSGNHRLLAERLRDGRLQVQAGELLLPGEVILAPGERYESPRLVIARSGRGLNGLSARLHPYVRSTVLGGRLAGKPRSVHYNTWEAIYFDHELETLKSLADLAAEVGAERYVLDDGWFRGRSDDRRALGDWTADASKYPQGLGPLIAHVRGRGLEFGLWVEPEMANADSDLLRAHPDWILGETGRDQPLGRGQYVLDLTRTEVSEAIFAQLDALLAGNEIGYLKWDMNRDLTHPVSAGRASVHRQTLAVYTLIDRLRAAHPDVEIESCASGGGRADYEILRRTERFWTSDCNDPIERQHIQRAFSLFFPPEVMGSHVGPRASHTTARSASLTLRALTALPGHFGIEADLRAFSEAERGQLAEAITLYKRLRPLLHSGRTLRLEHPDPGCLAFAVLGEGAWAGRGLVSAAQVETPRFAALAPLRLSGLDQNADYRLTQLAPNPGARAGMKRSPRLSRGEAVVASGRMLAQTGIALPVLRAGELAVFELVLARTDAAE